MFGFWEKLKKPIMALAPMADVTDAVFRRIIAKYSKGENVPAGLSAKTYATAEAPREGGPDVMFTEFVSADGLMLADECGKARLMKDLMFTSAERPIVAQFFSSRPEMIEGAAGLARELGFDGVDINMGCPDRAVERQGAGAALIKNPRLAVQIIEAAKRGAESRLPGGQAAIPVSVKTRVGYNEVEIDTWIPTLLQTGLAAIIIHTRTRKEMSRVPARWEHVKEAVRLRDAIGAKTLILGNGDLATLEDARRTVKETGADGALLGRAIFGNPFLFSGKDFSGETEKEMIRRKLSVALEHTKLFEKIFGEGSSPHGRTKNFAVMKKHYKAYIAGWDRAKELRLRLMKAKNAEEAERICNSFSMASPAKACDDMKRI